MKLIYTLFILINSIGYLYGQEKTTEKKLIGKYYYKLNDPPDDKYIIKLYKNGIYKEILKKSRLGVVKRFGIWRLVEDSIIVTINKELLNGEDNAQILYPNFSFKIENNCLCRTYVYCSSLHGCEKVETCYKKFGKRNGKHASQIYTKIDNPGYEGPWRNEKKK